MKPLHCIRKNPLHMNAAIWLEGGVQVDDTTVYQALWEALANCLVNADDYGR